MHFFNPVPKMKLVEIERGLETAGRLGRKVGRGVYDYAREE